jgi:hypothetical protein
MTQYDIITLVRDPSKILGKCFSFDAYGNVVKQAAVSTALALARQYHVPDIAALQGLLDVAAEDSHMAVINSAFPLVPVGQPFLILSEHEFEKLGIKRSETAREWPAILTYSGVTYPSLGRFTEHTAPSTWVLLDRDIDAHTPPEFATLSYSDWLVAVDKLLPGVLSCARLRAHSSSARVTFDGGQPAGAGNGHTWVQVANPADVERLRRSILPRAIAMGMAWIKPRHDGKTGAICGQSLATIVDPSVFVRGRLVFAGKPEVGHVNL